MAAWKGAHLELRGAVAKGDQDLVLRLDGRVSGADWINILLVDRPDLVPLLICTVPRGSLGG